MREQISKYSGRKTEKHNILGFEKNLKKIKKNSKNFEKMLDNKNRLCYYV